MLKQKHELKVNITPNDLQTAYALTHNTALMVNSYYKTTERNNQYLHRSSLLEAGVGYFESAHWHLEFENYAGIGIGNVRKQQRFFYGDHTSNLATFNANAVRLFFQPGVGYTSDFFDLILNTRMVLLKYTKFSSTNYSSEMLRYDYLDEITKPYYAFAEPAITARFGLKALKLQMQYGLTLNIGSSIRHSPDFGSLGLVFDIK